MKKFAVLLAVSACICVSAAAAESNNSPIRVDVRDAPASALLLELARLEQIPLVVGNRAFDTRITINDEFRGVQQAIDAIVQRTALKVSRRNGITVVTDACTPPLPPKPLNPFSENRLSLNFFRLDMPTALSLLQYVSSREIAEENFSGGNGQRVGMALQKQPARAIYEAFATATGTGLLGAANSSYLISELAPPKKLCGNGTPASTESEAPPRERAQCPRMTVYAETVEIPCQPLEFYKFEEIRIRGAIKRGEDFITIAETKDGLSWAVTTGQFMGENYAKVESITSKGLAFKELFINRYGYPFDRKFLLGFDGVRTELPD